MATHTHADGTVHENVHDDERAAVQYERDTRPYVLREHTGATVVSSDTRKTLGKGRIRGLQDRLTPEQADKRQAKILARRTVAEALTRQVGRTLGSVIAQQRIVIRQRLYLRLLSGVVGLDIAQRLFAYFAN